MAKSLNYILPIIDALLRQRSKGDRVGALVVYAMHALVNSQYQVLVRMKEDYARRTLEVIL